MELYAPFATSGAAVYCHPHRLCFVLRAKKFALRENPGAQVVCNWHSVGVGGGAFAPLCLPERSVAESKDLPPLPHPKRYGFFDSPFGVAQNDARLGVRAVGGGAVAGRCASIVPYEENRQLCVLSRGTGEHTDPSPVLPFKPAPAPLLSYTNSIGSNSKPLSI